MKAAAQAAKVPPLSAMHCALCGKEGVSIVVMWGRDGKSYERAWCGFECAKVEGWPFLKSEETPPRGRRGRSASRN
jgi:hypothetical protein